MNTLYLNCKWSTPLTCTFSVDSDFFYIIQEKSIERTLCLALSITSILIGAPFFFLMIQFERYGSDLKRTLLNRLTSMFLFFGLIFVFTVQIMELWRFIVGPLYLWVCFAQVSTSLFMITYFFISFIILAGKPNFQQHL